VSQQLEQAIQDRAAAAAELASTAAAAAEAEGQLASVRQELAAKDAQLKEAADKVSLGLLAVIRADKATGHYGGIRGQRMV
jgi:chromosome segregation ATPase